MRNLPAGFVHIPGKRVQPTCRRLGIDCVPALAGFGKVKGRYVPRRDGVVVRAEDAQRLRAALEEREARNTPEARARRRAARGRAHGREVQKAAAEIRERFPGMPHGAETRIARRAWEVGSGRVGRSRSAEDPIHAAVVAHIRHRRTDHDLLRHEYGGGEDGRELAREEVRDEVDRILRQWEGGPAEADEGD